MKYSGKNSDKPLVSWLMTIYNSAGVERAIKSMVEQTYDCFELIIVIEYGTDKKIEEICKKYSELDERIKLFWNIEKLGIAKSLNFGIRQCKGKYIARMDSDDYSYPSRLAIQVEYMEQHPTTGVLGGNARILQISSGKKTLRYQNSLNYDWIKAQLLFCTCFMHPTVMFRNHIPGLIYPERIVEDYGLFAEMSFTNEMAVISDVVIDYYDDPANTCNGNYESVRRDSAEVSKSMIKKMFGINTADFDNSLFGWRDYDNMPADPKAFLIQAIVLYKEIIKKNNELDIYDSKCLNEVLSAEWNKSLSLIRPYIFPELLCGIDKVDKYIVSRVFDDLEKDIDITKIAIYGTGHACKVWADIVGEEVCSRIVCYIDSDAEKKNKQYRGKMIVSMEEQNDFACEYIAIASFDYYEDIKKNLINNGFPQNKIVSLPCSSQLIKFHKEYIETCDLLSREDVNVLFCSCDYGNLGDHAIADAEISFFKSATGNDLIEIPCFSQRNYVEMVKKCVSEDKLICISGGGFLGSLWIEGEIRVREILNVFSNNPILIFPQTLFWEEGRKFEQYLSQSIYSKHTGELIICARDKKSKKIMSDCYPSAKILLVPDMVLSKKWERYFNTSERQGVLVCLKNDKESIIPENDRKKLIETLTVLYGKVEVNGNNLEGMHGQDERYELLNRQLQLFSNVELVVTDRLHGMIFSIITSTPCLVFDNCNHKLRETYNTWFKDDKNVRFVGSIDRINFKNIFFRCTATYKSDWSKEFMELKKEIVEHVCNSKI